MPSSTMHHQLRRATDSQSLSALAEPFKMYTLQGSIHPATVSGVPARMTAHVHSSPLAKVTLVASSVSPPSNSLLDAELDEEMERMVASVVNSPVEPGLSSELLPAPESISLAGPKLSIASQAALGSYRQRGLSGSNLQPPPPVVEISLPSPFHVTGPAGQPHTGYTTDELRLLGSSATSTQSAFNRPSKAALAGRARRSASVGSLPSLEQIRAWSQKRHGVTSEDQTIPAYSESHCTSDPSLGVGRAASTPIIQVLGASPPRIASPTTRLAQLASILGSTASNPTRQRAISVPSSPEKASYHVHADINRKTLSRTFCAKQMVSVLERRRSLSMVH